MLHKMSTADAVEYICADFLYATNMRKERLPEGWDFGKEWDYTTSEQAVGYNSRLQVFFQWNRALREH
eukprot:gene1339-40864_t